MIHKRIGDAKIRLLPLPCFDEGDLTEEEMERAFNAYWRDRQERSRRLLLNLEALSDLCCGIQQRIERMDRIAISMAANGVSIIAAFALIFFWTQSLALATFGF